MLANKLEQEKNDKQAASKLAEVRLVWVDADHAACR